jgi:hypothetical protein
LLIDSSELMSSLKNLLKRIFGSQSFSSAQTVVLIRFMFPLFSAASPF